MANEEHEGASPQELLIEACRRNNTDLLTEVLAGRPDAEITALLNRTTTVLGNHLYHEAASHGNYEIIDLLLDQPDFECDPVRPRDGDTPLHAAVRWLNGEPPAQREFGAALVGMMLEAGSDPRRRNRAGLTPAQLVDPTNAALRALIDAHQYAAQNAGDFVEVAGVTAAAAAAAAAVVAPLPPPPPPGQAPPPPGQAPPGLPVDDDDEFSGSDDEDRAEWERRKRERAQG